ncbi:hypothetical protein [Noviherbaspirillum sedimenti]|uniref:Copper resistance protein D domain-containing protein n=1 Tax=Noviherbaspirillum sedimenti TaxID=2320865 RepID=A0A3A3G2E4_9BURK|nr:hypothetical protein [Noviherbaspirillum sedimenti]RJG00999.1 hypothetical protein D3878_04855 [Noviherbaspirillum sedimenti]
MDLQNLSYTAIQVVHNFGAVAVVGSAACALWLAPALAGMRKPLSWIMLMGWAVQAASGGAFGGVSWLYYGRFPDIHGIAVAALLIKMACAAAGFMLVAAYIYRGIRWSERAQQATWRALAALAATALTAAAFLRWFS